MGSNPFLTESVLKTILASNSKLKDFMSLNSLSCTAKMDGLEYYVSGSKINPYDGDLIVTVKWTTDRLKNFGTELFQLDAQSFAKDKKRRSATALLANSIIALYFASSTKICTSRHLKFGFPKLNGKDFETVDEVVVPSGLTNAVKHGTLQKKYLAKAFSFTMNMLPTQIVDESIHADWKLPYGFDRLADLSFAWLRKIWSAWGAVYEFHAAAPCGPGIYAWPAGGQDTIPLKMPSLNRRLATAAMHDTMYPKLAETLDGDDILEAVFNSHKH